MTFKRHNREDMIKAFSKLCAIVKSCKTLPQLTTARNFVLTCKTNCGLSERMHQHLQDELNKQTQIIAKGT